MLETGSGSIYFADGFVRSPMRDSVDDPEAEEGQPARFRVLVVDDEKLIANTCAEILKTAGYDARKAYDGRAALAMMPEFQPHYLLTDVLMPKMNGVELAIAASKMSPETRILLFSGQTGISEILLQGRNQGYEFELIAKPIHPAKLIEYFRRQ